MLGKCLAGLPRDQIVVATKVGRYGPETFDFSAERVTASVHESLARLQLTYIDVIQCHDIEFGSLDQVCTLARLTSMQCHKKIKAMERECCIHEKQLDPVCVFLQFPPQKAGFTSRF